MVARLKKGDQVFVIAGRDKGKTGEILKIINKKNRVVVQGVNIMKRHTRPASGSSGGIVEKEMPIHSSNLLHSDPKGGVPTRIGLKVLENGKKVRFAKKSGEIIDS